jgi:membrane associated rhomboid family serine protease
MYYNTGRGTGFLGGMTPVIKNLVIINTLMLVITAFTGNFMYEKFSLFYFGSPLFKPYQLVTHMFMHGGFIHLFFNMYSLIFFGVILEQVWGSKKFSFTI